MEFQCPEDQKKCSLLPPVACYLFCYCFQGCMDIMLQVEVKMQGQNVFSAMICLYYVTSSTGIKWLEGMAFVLFGYVSPEFWTHAQ